MASGTPRRGIHRRAAAVVLAVVALTVSVAVVGTRAGGGAGDGSLVAVADARAGGGAGDGSVVADQPAVAGHAVVEPGQTLWDLAVRHGPDGGDPRAYLHRMRELNGFEDGSVRAWTVVLLPDR